MYCQPRRNVVFLLDGWRRSKWKNLPNSGAKKRNACVNPARDLTIWYWIPPFIIGRSREYVFGQELEDVQNHWRTLSDKESRAAYTKERRVFRDACIKVCHYPYKLHWPQLIILLSMHKYVPDGSRRKSWTVLKNWNRPGRTGNRRMF